MPLHPRTIFQLRCIPSQPKFPFNFHHSSLSLSLSLVPFYPPPTTTTASIEMAMTRIISQTLTHHKSSPIPLSPRILTHRHRSGKPRTAQIIEVDLDSSSSSSPSSSTPSQSDVGNINGGIKKLEEVIQNIIVRRSAPDWLPFRPGSSYWVPLPNHRNHPYGGVVEVIGKLSAAARLQSEGQIQSQSQGSSSFQFLSEDETMSFSSSRGWPSTSYFIEGSVPTYPVPMEVEVEVEVELKILDNSKGVTTNEDRED